MIESPDEVRRTVRKAAKLLTNNEKAAVADQLAEVLRLAEEVEEQRAAQAKVSKERLDNLYGQAAALGRSIREGDSADVECREELYFQANAVRVFRVDTGEQLEERAMTAEERDRLSQLPLGKPDLEARVPLETAGDHVEPAAVDQALAGFAAASAFPRCARCGHGWATEKPRPGLDGRGRRRPAVLDDGHHRRTGKCLDPTCHCEAFIPAPGDEVLHDACRHPVNRHVGPSGKCEPCFDEGVNCEILPAGGRA